MAAALTLVTLVASALRRAGPTPEQIPEDQFVFLPPLFGGRQFLRRLGAGCSPQDEGMRPIKISDGEWPGLRSASDRDQASR